MADFFNSPEPPKEPEANKFKIGEQEYSQEELSKYVGLGKQVEELEGKWNTKLDRVFPEYTKSRQELKDYKEKLEELEKQKNTPVLPADEAEARKIAREQAKKLGILTQDDLDSVFEKWEKERFPVAYQTKRQMEKLEEDLDSLSGKYDGSDGKPKFDKDGVLNYMVENGVKSPEKAYKLMNEDKLEEWKEKKIQEAKRENPMSLPPTGFNKQPVERKPRNSDELKQFLSESLWQNN